MNMSYAVGGNDAAVAGSRVEAGPETGAGAGADPGALVRQFCMSR